MMEVQANTGLWIRRFHNANDGGNRLVCFPHAGGSASFFFPLSAALSPEVDVLAVQYPGRQDRRHEEPIEDVHVLADRIADALRPRLAGPVVFFGHSMGAVAAYEVARRLSRDRPGVPARLVVSGRRAPSRRRDDRVPALNDLGVIEGLEHLGGTSRELFADEDMRRIVLRAVRGDYRAIEGYGHEPGQALRCPVTVFTGDRDPQVTYEEARAWRDHTSGPFDLHVFEGGHFYLSDRLSEVAGRLTAVLDAGRAGNGDVADG